MPYIKQNDREYFDNSVNDIVSSLNSTQDNDKIAGMLNYVISRICKDLCDPQCGGERRYARMNMIVGALESAKTEFNRRVVAPYEDEKISSEGDI